MKYMERLERIQVEADDMLQLELIGRLKAGGGWRGEKHSHPFWELLFINAGRLKVITGGCEYSLSEGKAVLLPPDMKHVCVNDADDPSDSLYIGFGFSLGGTPAAMDEADLLEQYPCYGSLAAGLRGLSPKIEKSGRGALYACRADIMALVYPLAQHLCAGSEAGKSAGDILVGKTKSYVKNNLGRMICVSEIAGSLYISPHYLGVTFRSVAGMTIKEYQLRQKMQKALYLIKSTELSLAEISASLGFNTPQYFTACFKNVYGTAPSKLK